MRKRSPTINCEREVKELHLIPGQVITLWLLDGKVGTNKRTQVEVRIDHDGNQEIFVDKDIVKPFKEWKSIFDDY